MVLFRLLFMTHCQRLSYVAVTEKREGHYKCKFWKNVEGISLGPTLRYCPTFARGTEEHYGKPHQLSSVSRLRFEPGVCRIRPNALLQS